MIGAALPSSASAGPARYVYEICDSALPGGGTPGVRFSVNPGVAFSGFNTCAQPGGGLGIAQTGHVNATYSFWSVPVSPPPGGRIESIAFSGAFCCAGPGTRAFAYEQGWPANNAGESQRIFQVSSSFFGDPWIFLGCDGNYAPGCSPGASIFVRYIAVTEVDPVVPKIEPLQGPLLGGGTLRGRQSLSAEASDVGGGLSKVVVSVNGLPAGQPNAANCNLVQTKAPTVVGTVAVTPTPCPASLKSLWTLDTAAYPFRDGANTVQVCASDYASLGEPNTACSAPHTVEVDNSCAESSIVGGEVLSARFARTRDEEITVPFDRPAKVIGELADNSGEAIGGATICVQMKTLGSGRGLAPVATTTTDENGQFSYQVPPGPNRRVMLGYRHNTFQVARSLHYFAHVRPTIKLATDRVKLGGSIHITGRVPGPRAAGRVVVLQAGSLHSPKWYPFREVTTNRHGVYRSRYLFDETTKTTTYRIRAKILRQRGYPWEKGHSKPALVEVYE